MNRLTLVNLLLVTSSVVSVLSQNSTSTTTKKPPSFFNVAKQVMAPKNNIKNSTADLLAKVAKKWKQLSIHGLPRAVPLMEDNTPSREYAKITLQNETTCHLHPLASSKNVTLHERVMNLVRMEKRLITFTIHFPEYDVNPLTVDVSTNYKPNVWFRTYDSHAYTLLALPFNYKIISLYTLWFGTAELDAEVVDHPRGCFPKLSMDDKLYLTMDLVGNDFKVDHTTQNKMYGHDPHVCHQIIKIAEDHGHFSYRCCRRRVEDKELECSLYEDSTWLNGLFVVLVVVDLLAFLFGPQFVDHTIFSEELHVKPYEVELNPPMDGTMCLEYNPNDANGKEKPKGSLFRQAPDETTLMDGRDKEKHEGNIMITKLLLKVDHRLLMSARRVPVGFFKFIYDNVFQCGMRRSEPFKSCFKSPVCWFNGQPVPQFKSTLCNRLAKLICTPIWKDFMKTLGNVLMLVCLPIPLYIRLLIYYGYESDEINARRQAIDDLGISMEKQYDLFYQLTPTHPFYNVVYGLILGSLGGLIVLRQIDGLKFEEFIVGAFKDLRGVKRFETFRLLITHFLLPFESCGICGIIFAPFYWIGMILASVIIIFIYSIPTIYLTFRFLFPYRPNFIKRIHCRHLGFCFCPPSKMIEKLSNATEEDGVIPTEEVDTTFRINIAERRLFLHRISPEDTILAKNNVRNLINDEEKETTYQVLMSDIQKKDTEKDGHMAQRVFQVAVGLCCVVFMWCSLILFCEVVGFFVEVTVFSFMGVIVNASSVGKFVTVALMLVLYSVSTFRSFHGSYAKLNRNIFKLLTEKLNDSIKAVTEKPADQQKDVAYRYLNDEEITKLGGKKVNHYFKRYRDHLVWKCKGLALFVDVHDTPRIPKKFFYRACEITVSGCPGKVVINLLKTIRQIVFMVLFLGFVLWVVILFHNVYELTSTQQLLFTLSGSFLPFLIRFLMQMRSSKDLNFNNYAFQGSINEILMRKYEQHWPICGFEYKQKTDHFSSEDRIGTDDISTCDRGTQTGLYSDPQPSTSKVKVTEDTSTDFACHIDMSPIVKKRRHRLMRKPQQQKEHCFIDLSIAQRDRNEELDFHLDVIGADKTV